MLGQLTRLEGAAAWEYYRATGVPLHAYGGWVMDLVEVERGLWADVRVWEEAAGPLSHDDAHELWVEAPERLWVDVQTGVEA